MAYRFWQLVINSNNGSSYLSICEMELRETVGGADVTTPSTPVYATSSISDAEGPQNVVNNAYTGEHGWTSGSYNPINFPQVLSFDLGSPRDIREVYVKVLEGFADRGAKDFVIKGSNTGEWANDFVDIQSFSNVTGWESPKTFALPSTGGGVAPATSPVRYIRDSINGSNANSGNHWSEIQAYDANGTNVALNKPVTGSVPAQAGNPYTMVTDGIISTSNFADADGTGLQSVTVDLGSIMEIATIRVWHYQDNRVYQFNKREVSTDGTAWVTIFDSEVSGRYAETTAGHAVAAPYAAPPPAGSSVPNSPGNVVATAGSGSATVSFSAPPSNGGAAIDQYRVTASTGQTATGTASPIAITMPNNVQVTFTVAAHNSVGWSEESAPSNAVTPQVPDARARPVVPGYIVKVYGDAPGDDFTTAEQVRAYVSSVNCKTLASKVMLYLDKQLDARNKQFHPAGSNNDYFITMRPYPGKSFDDLEPDNVPGQIGTLGIDVLVEESSFSEGIRLEALRFRGTGTGIGMHLNRASGNDGEPGGMRGCRLLYTGTGKAVEAGWGGATTLHTDNLIVIDGNSTQVAVSNGGFVRFKRNTFVRLNGAVGYPALRHEYDARGDSDNVFAGCGGNPIPNTTQQSSNNFTNTPLTTASSLITYVSGSFFTSATNYRPAAGSPMIGGATPSAISVKDNNGNNRGPQPDAGAFQLVPSLALASGTVTVQEIDGASLIFSANTAGNPTSGKITLSPGNPADGAQTVGPIDLVLTPGKADITVDDIPPGNYIVTATLTNAGGTALIQGATPFSIAGVGGTVYDTGSVGTGGGGTDPVDPTPEAPTVTVSVTMSGKTATINGTVNRQGDANGTVTLFADPQPSGTAIALGTATISGSTFTKQPVLPKGLYKVRAVVSANAQTATATSANFRVLGLTGNFVLPS